MFFVGVHGLRCVRARQVQVQTAGAHRQASANAVARWISSSRVDGPVGSTSRPGYDKYSEPGCRQLLGGRDGSARELAPPHHAETTDPRTHVQLQPAVARNRTGALL